MHRRAALGLIVCLVVAVAGASCSWTASGTDAGGDPPATTKLYDDSFKPTCQGAGVPRAKPYDKSASQHKVVYFSPFKDGLIAGSTDIPADWRVTYDPATDAYTQVDLVLCAVRTADTFVKRCDGYKDQKTGRSDSVANVHRATYEVSLREATTGKELRSAHIDANDDTCPMFVTFDDNTSTVEYYVPPPSDQVVAVATPFTHP